MPWISFLWTVEEMKTAGADLGFLACLRRSHRGQEVIYGFRTISRNYGRGWPIEVIFLHGVFFAPEASTVNGLADKRLLVGCELHLHTPSA